MDIQVIAECHSVAGKILESLGKQGFDIPLSQAISLDSLLSKCGAESEEYHGVIFVGVEELTPKHIGTLGQIRSIVSHDTKIALVTATKNAVDHGIVLKAIRAGACDILNADENLHEEIEAFLSRIHLENMEGYSRGKVLTIVPCSTTTDANILTANFAAAIATHSKTCGILDLHFRGSDLGILLKLSPRYTILDLLNQAETLDSTMFRQALTVHECGIELLPGPGCFSDLSTVRIRACEQIIRMAQHCWPVALVNAEDVQHTEQIRALAVSNEVVLAMRLDLISLHRTQKHIEFLLHNQVPVEHIHVVAMGVGCTGELPVTTVKKVLKTSQFHAIPDDPVSTIMSINIGNPLVLETPTSKASIAIKKTVAQILGYAESDAHSNSHHSMSALKAASMIAMNTLSLYR